MNEAQVCRVAKILVLGRRCNLEIWFEVGGGGDKLEFQLGGRGVGAKL